jgi:capsid assembly protease
VRAWGLATSVPWAITPDALEQILSLASVPREVRQSAAWAERLEAVQAQLGRPMDNTRAVTVRDGVAVVPVREPSFRKVSWFGEISGACSVESLSKDVWQALDSPTVSVIVLEVDSPGG